MFHGGALTHTWHFISACRTVLPRSRSEAVFLGFETRDARNRTRAYQFRAFCRPKIVHDVPAQLQRQELTRASVGVSGDGGPEGCESCNGFHQQPNSRGSQEDVSDATKIDIREVPVQSHAQERKR